MWVEIPKARYLTNSDFWTKEFTTGCSSTWSGIISVRPILADNCCWLDGNGSSIRIWEDPWIPGFKPSIACSELLSLQQLTQVWNVLHSLFSPTEATATSSIHIMGDNELKGLIKNTHSKNSLVPQFRHKLMKIGLDFKLHSEESMHYAWPSTFSFAHFKSPASETPTNQRQWVPPTSHIKINVDAAFGNTDGVAAAIARDSNGNI